jgi:hypothetical protein
MAGKLSFGKSLSSPKPTEKGKSLHRMVAEEAYYTLDKKVGTDQSVVEVNAERDRFCCRWGRYFYLAIGATFLNCGHRQPFFSLLAEW